MRTLSAPVVLSSMILAGWLTQAAAQDARPGMSPEEPPAASAQAQKPEYLPPGVIRKPTIDDPGTVVGIKLGQLYTDNLHLDEHKNGGWVTSVQPFVMTAYNGPRFSGVLDYTLSGYLYEGGDNGTQVTHHLDADGTLMLVPRHLFLDGIVTYSQAVIDHQRPAGSGTFSSPTTAPTWVRRASARTGSRISARSAR